MPLACNPAAQRHVWRMYDSQYHTEQDLFHFPNGFMLFFLKTMLLVFSMKNFWIKTFPQSTFFYSSFVFHLFFLYTCYISLLPQTNPRSKSQANIFSLVFVTIIFMVMCNWSLCNGMWRLVVGWLILNRRMFCGRTSINVGMCSGSLLLQYFGI